MFRQSIEALKVFSLGILGAWLVAIGLCFCVILTDVVIGSVTGFKLVPIIQEHLSKK